MDFRDSGQGMKDKGSQTRLLIERYNELELAFRGIEKECGEMDYYANRFNEDILKEMENVREALNSIKLAIERVEREKNVLSKEFRNIVKTDAHKRTEKRVDQLKYEEYISRDELYRLAERHK